MAYADVKFNFSIDDIMLSFLSYANRLNKIVIGYTLADVNKKPSNWTRFKLDSCANIASVTGN
jgi:hypothetical protein